MRGCAGCEAFRVLGGAPTARGSRAQPNRAAAAASMQNPTAPLF